MPSISSYTRMTKAKKLSAAGIGAASAAAVALTVIPGSADAGDNSQSTASKVSAEPTAFGGKQATIPEQRQSIAEQLDVSKQRAEADAQAKAETKSQKERVEAQKQENAEAGKKRSAVADKDAEKKAEKERDAKKDEKSSRGEKRDKVDKKDDKAKYPNNLDGWIREALDIMDEKGIPGSYEGIHRNIIRESGGDPNVVNDWDINAQNGVPSKGLLQVIQPTFDAYHVEGTPKKLTDPVANIVAACNYAADRYGSMDNVNSAY